MRASLPIAAKWAADGLELSVQGELIPSQLGASARREIRHLFASHQLAITALDVPMRFGLDVSEHQEARIDFLRQAMTLAFDLGCPYVVARPGLVPKDEKDPKFTLLSEALLALGQYGDRSGATLALESGAEDPAALDAFLKRLDTGSLKVTFNPGFTLVAGHDPFGFARTLRERIVYVHATDARRGLSPRLVTVGHGDIDWLEMMGVFEEIEYHGVLAVDAENEADASAGLAFLKRVSM